MRTELIQFLRSAAASHDQSDFASVVSQYEKLEEHYARFHANGYQCTASESVALRFCEIWADQVGHGFGQEFYKGLGRHDWSVLGRVVANHLEEDTAITSPLVLKHCS